MRPRFILASASPRRLDLLKQGGYVPDAIIPAELDETPLKREIPTVYVKRLALAKAQLIAKQHPKDIVLAADTTVACGRRILGKPADAAMAREFLSILSGRRHRVYTAVCIIHGEKVQEKLVETQLKFKRLTKDEIEGYVASKQWEGKAGGYAIQGEADKWVPWIGGSYSNVVGLPLSEVSTMLSRIGITPNL